MEKQSKKNSTVSRKPSRNTTPEEYLEPEPVPELEYEPGAKHSSAGRTPYPKFDKSGLPISENKTSLKRVTSSKKYIPPEDIIPVSPTRNINPELPEPELGVPEEEQAPEMSVTKLSLYEENPIAKRSTKASKADLKSPSRKLNLAMKTIMASKLTAPTAVFENFMELEWKNRYAAQQAHLIAERLDINPTHLDQKEHGKAVWKTDLPGIHKIIVMDRYDYNELPYPQCSCVILMLDRLIKSKHAHKLEKIYNNVTYREAEQLLSIAGNSWTMCVVIASLIMEFNEGAVTWMSAAHAIPVRIKTAENYPEVLGALETYITH